MKITAAYEHWWEAEFEIDPQKAAGPCLQSLEFFGDPIMREDESPEECVRAFIKFWLPQIIELSIRYRYPNILKEFAALEGTIPLDGSKGIRLAKCECWRWEAEDFVYTTDR